MEIQSDDGAEKRGADSGAAPCSATFDEWCKDRGENPKSQYIEIPAEVWRAAWNAAIEAAVMKTPGGSICDPQTVADDIRTLMSPNDQAQTPHENQA